MPLLSSCRAGPAAASLLRSNPQAGCAGGRMLGSSWPGCVSKTADWIELAQKRSRFEAANACRSLAQFAKFLASPPGQLSWLACSPQQAGADCTRLAASASHCDACCMPHGMPLVCSLLSRPWIDHQHRQHSISLPKLMVAQTVQPPRVSPQDKRRYQRLQLDNGLQVLLIQDPEMQLRGLETADGDQADAQVWTQKLSGLNRSSKLCAQPSPAWCGDRRQRHTPSATAREAARIAWRKMRTMTRTRTQMLVPALPKRYPVCSAVQQGSTVH